MCVILTLILNTFEDTNGKTFMTAGIDFIKTEKEKLKHEGQIMNW